ncbi:MAG: LysM domain-containing protein, partial [Armatimonadota bacterium]
GWVHSHAGWGVFMSDADLFIHQNFFTNPNHLCFVTDATIGRDAFFMWQNGEVTICSSYGLVGTTSEVGQPVKRCKKRKSRLDFKTIVIIILSLLLIYSWFFKSSSSNQVADQKSEENISVPVEITEFSEETQKIDDVKEYTIKSGDTLGSIARKYYGNAMLADKLAEYNDIKNIKSLKIGQVIKIPDKSVIEKL